MSRRRVLALLVVCTAALSGPATAAADRAFGVRYELNARGTIAATGNTLLSCATGAPGCAATRAGTGPNLSNNMNVMRYVDTDGVASTFASSSATLAVAPGATVAWAGLYWSGVDEANAKDCRGGLPGTAPVRERALLRFGSGPYQSITATQVDEANSPFSGIYGAFADVTAIVRAHGAGAYTVADIRALEGQYCHAGWSLVVVLGDAAQPLRNLTVIDGLGTVLASETSKIPFTLSGFRTPPTGPVRSTLGFVGYEGDLGATGDYAELDGVRLTNAANPATNFFNSTIADAGGAALGTPRDPTDKNQLGFDVDRFDASAIIKNDQRSATVAFGTNGDGYHPAVFTLATDIYEPALRLQKSVTLVKASASPPGYDALAEHGDTLRYAVTATNTGIGAAENVALADRIPAGTTYVPGSLTIDGVAQTDAENDDRAELAPAAGEVRYRVGTGASEVAGGRLTTNQASTVAFAVRVDDGVPDAALVLNQARALFTEATTGTAAQAFSNVVQTPVVVPDLTIAKTLTTAPPTPGTAESYELVASNVGTAPTRGAVTVTDTLPDDFDVAPPVTAAGAGWSCAVVVRSVTCTRADRLDRGQAYPPIVLTATLSAAFDGVVTNTAIVAGGGEVNTTNNSDTEASGAGPQADVGVVKTAQPDRVAVGSELTFAFLVGNSGPSVARDVRLADTIPAGFTILGVTAGGDAACSVAGQALACLVGAPNGDVRDLAPGQAVRIEVRVRAEAVLGGRQLVNSAKVTTATPDTDPANDTDTAEVTVDAVSDLLTTKTVAPAAPRAGGPIAYTITVLNRGPNVATGVTVADADVPAAALLTSVRVTSGTASCSLTAHRVVCQAPSIGVGESVIVVASGTVAAGAGGADLSNGVVAEADDLTTDPDNEIREVPVDGTPAADLRLRKTMAAAVAVGHRTRVSLRVSNAGPSPAENVIVTDTLPTGLAPVYLGATRDGVRVVRGSGGRCAGNAQRIACAAETVAAGASRTIGFDVRVTRSGGFRNTATAGSATPELTPADNTSTATTTTVAGTKTASRSTVRSGQSVRFALQVRNTGTRSGRHVDVCDVMPSGLHIVAAPGARTRSARRSCWRIDTLAAAARRRFSVTAVAARVPRPVRAVNHLEVAGATIAGRAVELRPGLPRVTG